MFPSRRSFLNTSRDATPCQTDDSDERAASYAQEKSVVAEMGVPITDDKAYHTLVYDQFYANYQADLGHYFRHLYQVVKYVDRSDVADKRFYTNLVRAQLSSHELVLLFYNSAVGIGQQKFKPLVERYALLKNMPNELLLKPEHKSWFEAGAFLPFQLQA